MEVELAKTIDFQDSMINVFGVSFPIFEAEEF